MKPSITVVALGPGAPGLMTLDAAEALRSAKRLILRTGKHGCTEWLAEQKIEWHTFDEYYERFEDFDEMHAVMARDLWEMARKGKITYGVMDPTTDGSVFELFRQKPEDGTLLGIAGLTAADACMSVLPDLTTVRDGIRILPANTAPLRQPDPALGLMITEIDTRMLASDLKLWLGQIYPDEMNICFFAPSEKSKRKAVVIPLEDLDRQKRYNHTVCAYIPPVSLDDRTQFCMHDLLNIMNILRSDDGCPWDREQTHESLRASLIEEAYEAAGAIDEQDDDHLADELGDVLLQVVFHSAIGESNGSFNFTDVITAICRKMIRRHPHVFGQVSCADSEEVSLMWDRIKQQERGLQSQQGLAADVSRALPALTRAWKVSKRAARAGIVSAAKLSPDSDLTKALEKTFDTGNALHEDRIGDLLWLLADTARQAGIDPEEALQHATDRFITMVNTSDMP